MSVISIDFGNENFVVASPGRGGVDVLSNQASKRLNPTMVAFDNERRYAGIFAQTQQASNFAGTISNLKRLIGIKSNDTEKKVLKRLISAPLVDLPDGSTGVELKYNNKKSVFRIEQLLSLLISECFKISMANSLITKDCVIVVSPWWGEKQRRVVLDAAEICGFNVLKLLNSPTAAAVAYSAFNRTKLPTEADKSVSVLIADIGDSSMNVVVAQLYQGSVEVRGFCTDEHLGGSHFTDAFEEFLLQKTKQKYRLDPSSNPRAMFRFRKSVEVTKKTLSINPVTRFDVPSLMNDVDVSFEVKRDEFESVIVSLVNRIEFPLAEALKLANIESKDLFAIEIHGGGSRVPAVKKKIAAVLGKEPTQSLNPDECFAVGAGFQAAILSPQYKVNLDVKDVSPHSVFVEYLDLDQKRQRIEIFQKFNVVPSTKKVPIKVIRKALITVSTDEDEIGKIEIDTEKEEILLIQVLIRLSPNSLIELKQAAYYVTEEIEEPAEKEGEEPKKKTVKKEIKVKSSYSHSFGLKAGEIAKLKQLEKEMSHKDDLEERTDEIRNELESLIFRLSNGITRDFPEYFDPSKKKEFLAKVLDVQNWFSENEFERLTLAEYESKLNLLKEIGDPAIKRKEARDTLPKVLKDFEEEADNLYNRLTKKDANLSHITQEERDPVIKQIQDFKAWLIQKKEAVEKSPHHLDIPFKKSDAEHKRNDIERAVNTCLAKPKPPPPPPPKEEPKEGETKEESKEADKDSATTENNNPPSDNVPQEHPSNPSTNE
jgi:molecular chaperone DnaK (HSP70)